MNIRQAGPDDYESIKELYQKMAFDYTLPTMDEFVDIQVVVNENDKIIMCLAARKEVNYYLLMDPECELNPFMKWEYFKKILSLSFDAIRKLGFHMCNAWLPPEIEKSFGRRLQKVGAKKAAWPCYSRDI